MSASLAKLIASLIGAAVTAISAWEMRERLKRRDQRLDRELEDGVMETSMTSEKDGQTFNSTAVIRCIGSRYRLTIRSDSGGIARVNEEREFSTREQLERHLDACTSFRLGDFVRRI